jgi:two-component system, cell cycle response regulator
MILKIWPSNKETGMQKQPEEKKVLLVEDNPSDVFLLELIFQNQGGNEFKVSHVPGLEMALKILAAERFDAILLDLFLPETYGLETLVRLHVAHPQTPIIVLTGYYDERTTSFAKGMGACDYLSKDDLAGTALMNSLRRHIKSGMEASLKP